MARPPKYKIHPAIGIARLGDPAAAHFIGPEIPGIPALAPSPGKTLPEYKDGGKIKPQAARFHVYEYLDKGGTYEVSREIDLTQKDVGVLRWGVHLANRKASFFNFDGLAGFDRRTAGKRNAGVTNRKKLEIDPGMRFIAGASKGPEHFTSKNPAKERWPDPKPVPEITTLGRLLTDGDGRLMVLGGSGQSVSLPLAAAIADYANNDGWFDDVSDGPVIAFLRINGKVVDVEPGWVICSPPDFAPSVTNVITLYDVLYDIAARELSLPKNEATYANGGKLERLAVLNADFKANKGKALTKYKPDFDTEIYPILARAANMSFVYAPSTGSFHSTLNPAIWPLLASIDPKNKSTRNMFFNFLRPPDLAKGTGKPDMPKLLGDEPYNDPKVGGWHQRARATLTITQYEMMKRWVDGKFLGSSGAPGPLPLPQPITPEGLDRSALEACVGAAMYPGIEVSWQIRFKQIFKEPFRIKHGAASPYPGDKPGVIRAGHFTRQMALPWQADFRQCKMETATLAPFAGDWGWWPAQRPDSVYASKADQAAGNPMVLWHRSTKGGVPQNWVSGGTQPNDVEMMANWKKFGFVIDQGGGVYIEQERAPDIP
ncbi:MAG: LodA/GoxA family CTQ-dependent oxidase [Nitrospirota bacterium]